MMAVSFALLHFTIAKIYLSVRQETFETRDSPTQVLVVVRGQALDKGVGKYTGSDV